MAGDARERPIIFSAPMVRAILDGRKTQTRRIIKLPTKMRDGGAIYERPDMGGWDATTHGGGGVFRIGPASERIPVPEEPAIWHRTCGVCMTMPWKVGYRAWVRETWAPLDRCTTNDPGVQALVDRGFYRADDSTVDGEISRWTPAIHMPRWASRLTLLIEDVRVQRLQDISEEDAVAEGAAGEGATVEGMPVIVRSPIEDFRDIWRSIHGSDAWDRDPWVVALTFRRIAGDHHG